MPERFADLQALLNEATAARNALLIGVEAIAAEVAQRLMR